MGLHFEGDLLGKFDVFPTVIGCRPGSAGALALAPRQALPGLFVADVAARDDAETAIGARRPGEIMHELRPTDAAVAMPRDGAVRPLVIDTTVAQVEVVILLQLSGELEDFRVQHDSQERQAVVQRTPVGTFQVSVQSRTVGSVV